TLLVSIAYFQRIEQREVVSIQARKSGVLLQMLTGIRKLRVAGAEMRAFGLWAQLFCRQRHARRRIWKLGNVWKMFAATMPLLASAVLFTVILVTSSGESLKIGSFLAFM